MKLLRDGYSDELPVPLSEFERAQLFRRIEAELDARPRRPRPLLIGAAVALALAAGVAIGFRTRTAPAESAPMLVVPNATRETIELPDGSRALLDPSTELRIDAAEPLRVRLTLLEGRASFEVGQVEGRSFVVGAGSVDVNVLGGKVAVAFAPAFSESDSGDWAIEVHATEGRVSVHRQSGGGAPVTLEAGERWSSVGTKPAPSDAPPASAGAPAP